MYSKFVFFRLKNHNKYMLNFLIYSGYSVSTQFCENNWAEFSWTEFTEIWLVKSHKTVCYRTFKQPDWFRILNGSRDFSCKQKKNVKSKQKRFLQNFREFLINDKTTQLVIHCKVNSTSALSLTSGPQTAPADMNNFQMLNCVIWREKLSL